VSLRPTGTAPENVQRAATLRIDQGMPMPKGAARGVIRNTLATMQPGDSFLAEGTQLSNVYKWAKKLRLTVRIKRLAGDARAIESRYRVWRLT
jgi:hypothetical protein